MRNRIIHEEYDLRIYPEEVIEINERVVLGDMHGNALKLLFLLIKFNIVKLEKVDYLQFHGIYLKEHPKPSFSSVVLHDRGITEGAHIPGTGLHACVPDTTLHAPLTPEDFQFCKNMINRIKVNKSAALCLIGDLLADRGKNDILTLLIIMKLSLEGIDLEIIFSNHDLIFIHKMESAMAMRHADSLLIPLAYQGVLPAQRASLDACIETIALGFITQAEVFTLYSYYKKHLILLNVYEQPAGLTLVSHAPIGLNNITEIANLFSLDKSLVNLAKPLETHDNLISVIQNINALFRLYVAGNCITTRLLNSSWMNAWPRAKHPVMKLLWSRDTPADAMRPPILPDGTPLEWAHGHTDFRSSESDRYGHIHALDNGTLGFKEHFLCMMTKLGFIGPTYTQGIYVLLDITDPSKKSQLDAATSDGYFPSGEFHRGDCPVLLVSRSPGLAIVDTANATIEAVSGGSSSSSTILSERTAAADASAGTGRGPGLFSTAPAASAAADATLPATDETAAQTPAAGTSRT